MFNDVSTNKVNKDKGTNIKLIILKSFYIIKNSFIQR